MKGLLIAFYSVCLAAGLVVRADDGSDAAKSTHTAPPPTEHKQQQHPPLTEEQKALRKDLLAKYDTNKDGKLDADERKKVSSEDKPKLKKAGLTGKPKKAAKKTT